MGVPGWISQPVSDELKRESPFTITLVCDSMDPCTLGEIIPEAETALGGHHASFYSYTQDSIDAMTEHVQLVLRRAHSDGNSDCR
jgi:hypothetical protein